jgi:uridine nucleosidase
LDLKNSKGYHIQFLSDMCKFYRDWHAEFDGFHGI